MDVISLDAQPRAAGTKIAKQARREGFVPCVLYGHELEPVIFQLGDLDMHRLVFTNQRSLLDIKVGKKSFDCILKDVDFHPVSDKPIHADFQILKKGEKIRLTIPIQFEGKAIGVVEDGGEVQYILHDLEIESLPKNIPDHIVVNISGIHLGQTLHVSDLEIADVEITTPAERSIVAVVAPRKEEEVVVEEVEGLLEGAEIAEGEGEGEGEAPPDGDVEATS